MYGWLRLSAAIDGFVAFIAKIGAWAGVLLVLVVVYDVITRYFGVARAFGLNATQLQESEYWLHTILFSLMLGFGYSRQAHVRIDLVRTRLPLRLRYGLEAVGCLLLLLPYCAIAIWVTFGYVEKSFLNGEVSKSTNGLSHLWILKSMLLWMFVLLGLAGISQLIKSLSGLTGNLPDDKIEETLGEGGS